MAERSPLFRFKQRCLRYLTAAALLLGSIIPCGLTAQAQPTAPYPSAPKQAVEARPRWDTLNAAQRDALKPLEREWPRIDFEQKRKWLAIAAKFPSLPPQERLRIQDRMADWAKLSPQERGVARQQFQAAKRVAPQDRPSQWEAYQALPSDQKRQLAARAAAPSASASDRQRRNGAAQVKMNIVPNPAYAVQPTPVNAMALQAQPGATTTSITKRASPPAHQQTGLPKIAASQGFVDKTTLLPKRGPQGAATRSAAASEPTRRK